MRNTNRDPIEYPQETLKLENSVFVEFHLCQEIGAGRTRRSFPFFSMYCSSTFTIETIKSDVLTCGLFRFSSVKQPFILDEITENLEVSQEHELRENSEFIQYHRILCWNIFKILNVNTVERTFPSWTRSTLSHDQVIHWTKAKESVHSDSVLCLVKRSLHSEPIRRWESQVVEFQMSASCGELNSSGTSFQDLRHCRFLRRSRMISQSGTLNLKYIMFVFRSLLTLHMFKPLADNL